MRLLNLPSGHSLFLYGSIFELSAEDHSWFEHWLVRDSGIGSGAAAIERHFAGTAALLAAGRNAEAGDALALLHYAYADTLDRLNPKQMAFGCLVAQVDGQPWTDRSEEGLRRLISQLSEWGLTQGQVEQEVATAKKQLRRDS
ncbi:MAG: hypothetical protein ACRYFX_00910 [Janthinobacterium lividum]